MSHRFLSKVNRHNAFTLVELMVAMTISVLLMISLISIVTKAMDVSKRQNTGMIAKGSAQAALDLMVTDLDSLLINRNSGEVFRYTNLAVSGAPNLTNATLYLLTTSMEDSYSTNPGGTNAGFPTLVQYTILYTNTVASTNAAFGLYRNVLDPTNTFNNVIGSSSTLDTNWITNSVNNPTTNLLVANVVGMNVTMYTNFGTAIWTNGSITNTSISATNFPRGVELEISVTVLDEPALSRYISGITNSTTPTGFNAPTNIVAQFGRTLIRRITLPSPP